MIAIKQLLLALGILGSPVDHPIQPCVEHCQISDKGLAVIRHFEGFSPLPYDDGAGYLTIGFGHKILPGEKFDAPLLGKAAENLLRKDLEPKVKAVNVAVRVPLYQWQWDAVFSLSFNAHSAPLWNPLILFLLFFRPIYPKFEILNKFSSLYG